MHFPHCMQMLARFPSEEIKMKMRWRECKGKNSAKSFGKTSNEMNDFSFHHMLPKQIKIMLFLLASQIKIFTCCSFDNFFLWRDNDVFADVLAENNVVLIEYSGP